MFIFLKDLRPVCFSQVSITHRPEVQTVYKQLQQYIVNIGLNTQHSILQDLHRFIHITYYILLMIRISYLKNVFT